MVLNSYSPYALTYILRKILEPVFPVKGTLLQMIFPRSGKTTRKILGSGSGRNRLFSPGKIFGLDSHRIELIIPGKFLTGLYIFGHV